MISSVDLVLHSTLQSRKAYTVLYPSLLCLSACACVRWRLALPLSGLLTSSMWDFALPNWLIGATYLPHDRKLSQVNLSWYVFLYVTQPSLITEVYHGLVINCLLCSVSNLLLLGNMHLLSCPSASVHTLGLLSAQRGLNHTLNPPAISLHVQT